MLTSNQIGSLKQGKTLKELNININEVKEAYPLINFPYTFGVELEFLSLYTMQELIQKAETYNLPLVFRNRLDTDYSDNSIRITSDGSVRSDSSLNSYVQKELGINNQSDNIPYLYGAEIITPILDLTKINTLYKICKFLNRKTNIERYGRNTLPIGLINKSCGLHVHFGTQGLTETQKASCYYTFKTLEPYIHNMVPEHRHNNSYCKSILGMPYSERLNRDKYYTINILHNLNTFEYRLFNGTTNFYTIKHVVYILMYIYHYGKTHNVLYSTDINLYDVLENPILWNFYNSRMQFIKKQERELLNQDRNTSESADAQMLEFFRPTLVTPGRRATVLRRIPITL